MAWYRPKKQTTDNLLKRGLFLAHHDNSIAFRKDRSYTERRFNNFIKNKDALRWDKPIEKQKAEEKAASNKLHGKQNN